MLALVQRVRRAKVVIAGDTVGAIDQGLLVLVCAEQGDAEAQGEKLLAKLLKLRIFSDADGKMNRSVQDLDGVLKVLQRPTRGTGCTTTLWPKPACNTPSCKPVCLLRTCRLSW